MDAEHKPAWQTKSRQVAKVYSAQDRPLHVVARKAPKGGRGQEACSETTAEQVIGWYAKRWSIEVMNHDSKQYLGSRNPRAGRAVERTPPLAMLLYSRVVLWFAREDHRHWRPLFCP